MPSATVTSKGQVTIPKAVRQALDIKTGDRLLFRVRSDGLLEIHVQTADLLSLGGILQHDGATVSLADMEEAIGEGSNDG
jgi:antitoxin PrlF